MKQVIHNLNNGSIDVSDIPIPNNTKSENLIRSVKSLISTGTERMLVEFGNSNYLNKAFKQPEKVKMVLEKIKNEGISAAYETVSSKLDQPMQLGYSNVGYIEDPGNGPYKKGTRVVSNGPHAEFVCVPHNLTAKIPDNVDFETASFTVPSAIALQGIRLANPTIGENFVVVGLGLIGLLSVQILRANGCRVIGIDYDQKKCELAEQYGAKSICLEKGVDQVKVVKEYTDEIGADGVIIAASSNNNEIVHNSALMSRKRGRIILVGVVGLKLDRVDFYEKELSFQVSCSYGPGRYDDAYEIEGTDYPLPYVRWTEKRNFEAVLNLMSEGFINTKDLISNIFSIEDAKTAYNLISSGNPLGVLISYEDSAKVFDKEKTLTTKKPKNKKSSKKYSQIAVIGAGNYSTRMLIPKFKKLKINLNTIISKGGVSAAHYGKRFNFDFASSNFDDALTENIDSIVIATRHNLHAEQTIAALNSNKNVFVEKPLALNLDELEKIKTAFKKSDNCILTVGFNRRFSPHVQKIKNILNKNSKKSFIFTMNAGHIPSDHWTQKHFIGGGRIIGEACHYIDLMRFFAGSKIVSWNATKMKSNSDEICDDKSFIILEFEDGSTGCINYLANGGRNFPKERIEIFENGATYQIDNFKKTIAYNSKAFKKFSTWRIEKGQSELIESFINSVNIGNESPIPFDEIYEVSRISIEIANHLR